MNREVAILQLLSTKGLGVRTLQRILARLEADQTRVEEMAIQDWQKVLADFRFDKTAVDSFMEASRNAEKVAEDLAHHDIRMLLLIDDEYPKRLKMLLGKEAPPVLFIAGNLDILQRPAVAFTGSRKASEKGLKITRAASNELAAQKINVISGYANGVDLVAHRAAFESGGVTTIVLAEGILHFRIKRDLADVFDRSRALVISEFSPRLPWQDRQAMQRNKTIIGLSKALVLIEAGKNGGTFEAGRIAQELKHPLFVVEYTSPPSTAEGNAVFLKKGATPLRSSKENGQPNLRELLKAVSEERELPTREPDTLFSRATKAKEMESQPMPTATEKTKDREDDRGKKDPKALPKRLIEVDLPIKEISAHARREKSIRHGHISTLHIWWARRPLAACRAVICAALWPDPMDENCPQAFRNAAAKILCDFAEKARTERHVMGLVEKHYSAWNRTNSATMKGEKPTCWPEMRYRLLDFIADFANWDASAVPQFLETARSLTQAAHEAFGGISGTKPLLFDPFAGGGAIPLEALRVGAEAFASDLNPLPVLLNKIVLEYIPKYGNANIVLKDEEGNNRTFKGLAEAVRFCGHWIKERAERELADYYPKDSDGSMPIGYLWARTIKCEGPGCGAEVPLLRSLWLARKGKRSIALTLATKGKEIVVGIDNTAKPSRVGQGTTSGGAVTCPVCGFTTAVERVRTQLSAIAGGASSARLVVVVVTKQNEQGREYRLPNERDHKAIQSAKKALAKRVASFNGELSLIPDEQINHLRGFFNVVLYGIKSWGDLFTFRQALSLVIFSELVKSMSALLLKHVEKDLAQAIQVCMALSLGKQADRNSSVCRWISQNEAIGYTFGRQALPMNWDFIEMSVLGASGSWGGIIDDTAEVLEAQNIGASEGTSLQSDAANLPMPDDTGDLLFTDPPYYSAVPYADLSDFFYVWLKRTLSDVLPTLFSAPLSPKELECVALSHRAAMYREKDAQWFENRMGEACKRARIITKPKGIGCFVFANKETAGWEAMLKAIVDSGWVVTGSWPIDTERPGRLRAQNSAALASSIHIVCRPRENLDGTVCEDSIGMWRNVLAELPVRIQEWMPRLKTENVVGADAIFACLGPALEIFSRYSRVERASGEAVTLREYLEQVWAAVSKEALSMIFEGADATGFEEDARLTAMWLWTLSTGGNGNAPEAAGDEEPDEEIDEEYKGKAGKLTGGFVLEYDAARKIAQGLGAHLEALQSLVEVKGDKARLRPVAERAAWLFGKTEDDQKAQKKREKVRSKKAQMSMFEPTKEELREEAILEGLAVERVGETTLDRVHQAMLLFGNGRGDALKRFLVDDGAGRDAKFWKLAQALVALYPQGTEERRWAEGLQARKKGLGL